MIQTFLTVIPIVTAGLYLLGLTFHQGFLWGFGIEETLFPLSVDRTLFKGFEAFINLSATPAGYLLLAAIAIMTTAILTAVILSNKGIQTLGHWLTTKFHRPTRATPLPERALKLLAFASTFVKYLLVMFVIYLGLVVVAVVASRSGKEEAAHFIENAVKSKNGFVNLYLSGSTEPIIAKPILCSPSHCAYWLGTEAVLYRHESVEKVVIYNPADPGALPENKAK